MSRKSPRKFKGPAATPPASVQPTSPPARGPSPDSSSSSSSSTSSLSDLERPSFWCGVVEGFYSRPWSTGQRLDLFAKMGRWGLNTYLYAPKDDHKHRAQWRVPYSPVERAELKVLIQACQAHNVRFFYGISPGLDMGYSQSRDLDDLVAKLSALRDLGCRGFAILWDDIDTTLPPEDAHAYRSLAQAHVQVTNAAFERLTPAEFLTCPVEYCTNRADPNVERSEYLNTLGQGLHPDIAVFWTGSKVVSETIGPAEMRQLEHVLKRKPLIWDNLHANDYDKQRMFLGPFSGRDPQIIPHVRGVLINPNCEYSLNIPALFTLSAWSLCRDPITGHIQNWNPVEASELAIPHFLEELHRKTAISIHETTLKHPKAMELSKCDVELLFHLFWLPHSHGSRAEMMLNEFKYLRDTAHVLQYYDLDPTEGEQDKVTDSAQQEFVDSWMERASSFNNTCKRFSKICDKFTYINNRELFFDINGYLNNMQVVLSACNRLLKWVGLDKCRRPIHGGPTLSGLPGGMAGDLQRLYPIRSNFEYPVRSLMPSAEKNAYAIQPIGSKSELEELRLGFPRLFCESQGIEEDDLTKSIREFALKSRLDAFTSGSHRALTVDCDDVLMMSLVGSRDVKAVVKALKSAFQSIAKAKPDRQTLSIALPTEKEPMLEKYDAILSYTSLTDLIFTKTSDNVFKLMFMLLGDIKNACVLVEKCTPISRQYLLSLKFKEVHRGPQYGVMAYSRNDDQEDEMEIMTIENRVDVDAPLWDQSTFYGRFRHFAWMTNPLNTLASDAELMSAKQLVDQFRKGQEPPETTQKQLINAMKLYQSSFHPDTGELQNVCGRMCFQVPGGMTITGAMLQFYKTVPQIVFWQWFNQSFNALVNFTNRNAESPVSKTQLAFAYASATFSALGTAIGLKKGLEKLTPPVVQRFVPFVAVGAANCVNIPLMRQTELLQGVDLRDEDELKVCSSKFAAQKGITQVVISRNILMAPGMVLVPVIMQRLEKRPWFARMTFLHAPFQVLGVGTCLLLMVPIGCAVYPQNCAISVAELEQNDSDAFQELKKNYGARPLPQYLYFNKGL
eukprot:TCALIF_08969-PA protein Name:"Similar to SFXN2 Sideroflexin-2 (Homo sapiens)" AED:0.07 eAED:0.07 QI:8/0.66/0.57/1/0.83/0.71/7/214/1069